jgi:nicotinamidase-related amidase
MTPPGLLGQPDPAAGTEEPAADGRGGEIVEPLLPQPGDRVLLEHRYSAFDHTALELLVRSLDLDRVVSVGSATEHAPRPTHTSRKTALGNAEEVGGVRVRRPSRI